MFESIWFKLFMVNWVINILLMEFFVVRKLKIITNVNEERDSKYAAFRRYDTFWWNRPFLYLTCPFHLLRTFGFLVVCGVTMYTQKFFMGKRKADDPLTGFDYKAIRVTHYICTVLLFLLSGIIWFWNTRPKISYAKYLGKDWKPNYDTSRLATVISNH